MALHEGQLVGITGATGFIGGALCRRLVEEGCTVRAYARNPEKAKKLEAMGVEVCIGDIRDADKVHQFLQGVDMVYHIAGNFRDESVSEEMMYDINYGGTKNMLEAAEANGVKRFLHCSTCGVHGHISNPPANEESPYNPGDYYQRSKLKAEKLVWEYINAGKFPISIYRSAGVYGAGDTRFLKMAKGIQKRRFPILGDGKTLFQMIYIDDLVDGIILAGTKEEAIGNVYILIGDEHVELDELAQMVADITDSALLPVKFPFWPVYYAGWAMEILFKPLGINPPLYRRRVDFFRKDRWFDISKAQTDLGFQPKIDLREGLEKQIQWYRDEGLME